MIAARKPVIIPALFLLIGIERRAAYQRIKDFLSGQRGGGHVDRSVIVVYPKTPYVKWTGEDLKANGLDPEKDGTAYLVPMASDLEELDEGVEYNWAWLFEHQLSLWTEDETEWPKNRSRKMFKEWFEVRIADMVIDIVQGPIRKRLMHVAQSVQCDGIYKNSVGYIRC
ncbi:MAG TPA: hypothetical protein VF268_01165 [Gammaproteobacteria bacterium]